MALAEDAASVLEQFVQDVANLPAEIAHLLEEIQAKDRLVQDQRTQIATRDLSIQKHLKAHSCTQPNPKEEAYCKTILTNFDRAQAISEEKVSLSDKAALLLDRQIKRLDFKIRDLQNEGAIQPDPQLPSLLTNTSLHTRLLPSTTTTGASTPLSQPPPGASTTIANNPLQRLVQPRQPSPLTSLPSNANPITAASRQHARSPSTDPSKRRRLNPHAPPTTSSLRQSSLGPGTPKSLTDPTRGSSAGPRPTKKSSAAHPRVHHLNPTSSTTTKKSSSLASSRRRAAATKKASTPASAAEDSAMDDEDAEGDEDQEMEGEDERDDQKYCTCRSVSYGNMVACDNDGCPYEWFHWSCVGVQSEPKGKWFCPECRKGRS